MDERARRELEVTLEKASKLVASGDTTSAILEYMRAFEIAPDNELAAQGYVSQVSRLGATSNAINQHSKRLAKSPNELAARLLLAELLRSEFRFNDALDHYWLARRRDKDNPVAMRGIAESLLGLGFLRNAEETFAQLALHEGKARDAANRARVMLADERPETALCDVGLCAELRRAHLHRRPAHRAYLENTRKIRQRLQVSGDAAELGLRRADVDRRAGAL